MAEEDYFSEEWNDEIIDALDASEYLNGLNDGPKEENNEIKFGSLSNPTDIKIYSNNPTNNFNVHQTTEIRKNYSVKNDGSETPELARLERKRLQDQIKSDAEYAAFLNSIHEEEEEEENEFNDYDDTSSVGSSMGDEQLVTMVRNLPTQIFSQSQKITGGANECCICLEQFKNGDTLKRLPCLHLFHQHEIDEWLKQNHICPICRIDINKSI